MQHCYLTGEKPWIGDRVRIPVAPKGDDVEAIVERIFGDGSLIVKILRVQWKDGKIEITAAGGVVSVSDCTLVMRHPE